MKEHPVLSGRIVYYLHQCRLPEIFENSKDINIMVQWMSTVFPAVFDIDIINMDFMRKLDEEMKS